MTSFIRLNDYPHQLKIYCLTEGSNIFPIERGRIGTLHTFSKDWDSLNIKLTPIWL